MCHFRKETFLADYTRLRVWTALALLAISAGTILARTTGTRVLLGPPLPEGTGKDITHKVCGATCHGTDVIVGKGRTRDQWTAVVNAMAARGAKASDTEFVQITEYLSSHFGPNSVVPSASARGNRPGADAPRASGRGPGPLGFLPRHQGVEFGFRGYRYASPLASPSHHYRIGRPFGTTIEPQLARPGVSVAHCS